MKLNCLVWFIVLLLLIACENAGNKQAHETAETKKMRAVVENTIELNAIPSGSGLVKEGDNYYLVSDDAPFLFRLDRQFNLREKIAIPVAAKTTELRIPKAVKPDYESAAIAEMNGRKYLLAFGSGTKSPQRDSLLLVNLKNLQDIQAFSLRPFYELIKTAGNLTDGDINLEGSVIIGQDLFLFNRGKNVLVQTNWPRLFIFLKGGPNMLTPEIKTYRISLPQIKGIDPGFSGACQLGNENKILFTASVEDTQNWIDDGEILGSFVGILDIEKLESRPLEQVALLTDSTANRVIEKVESVEYLGQEQNGDLKILCLTDDDKGGSKILEVRLQQQ